MEPERFDDVVLNMTSGLGRRRLVGMLSLLGMASVTSLSDADAKKKKKKKKKKKGTKGNGCANGLTRCWSYDPCRDLQTDPENCGACDIYCKSGEQCIRGVCRIPCEPNACHVATFESDFGIYQIALSPDGTLVGTTGSDNRISFFRPDGTLIKVIGEFGTEPGEFDYPEGIAVGSNGDVYVADSDNDRIQVIRTNGTIDLIPADYYPEFVAVSPAGAIYTEIYGQMARINESGEVLYQWGPGGSGSEDFDQISDIAIGPDGDVYVLEGYNGRMSRFSDDGNGTVTQKWSVGSAGADPGEFDAAGGITVRGSEVFVSDSDNHRVQIFDAQSGSYVLQWSLRDEYDYPLSPGGIAVDSSGRVYLAAGDIYVYERLS